MEKLFLELNDDRVPLSEDMVQKYDLKKGMYSPFTRNRIVNEKGDFIVEKHKKDETFEKQEVNKALESEMQETFDLSTSEILDISEGVDSDNM